MGLTNTAFIAYLFGIFLFLSISIGTNVILQQKFTITSTNLNKNQNAVMENGLTTLNELSNNGLAVLLLPVYVPYRCIKYGYNHFDLIVEWMTLQINKIICNIIDSFRFIFVDVIYKIIILNVVHFCEYMYENVIIVFYNTIINGIVRSFYQILELLEYFWNLFCDWVIYPIGNILNYLYTKMTNGFITLFVTLHKFCTGVLYKMYNGISNALSTIWDSLATTFIALYNVMSNTLSTIWDSLTTTLTVIYDNICISIMRSWNAFINMF